MARAETSKNCLSSRRYIYTVSRYSSCVATSLGNVTIFRWSVRDLFFFIADGRDRIYKNIRFSPSVCIYILVIHSRTYLYLRAVLLSIKFPNVYFVKKRYLYLRTKGENSISKRFRAVFFCTSDSFV